MNTVHMQHEEGSKSLSITFVMNRESEEEAVRIFEYFSEALRKLAVDGSVKECAINFGEGRSIHLE